MKKVFLMMAVFYASITISQDVCRRIVGEFNAPTGENPVSGQVALVDSIGQLYVVLGDDFSTVAGPDLYIYLGIMNVAPTISGNTHVEVAALASNTGAQTYEVPSGVGINDYNYVLIHCNTFNAFWNGGELGELDCGSGVNDANFIKEHLSIYNTTASDVIISLRNTTEDIYVLSIYSLNGQLLYSSYQYTNSDVDISKVLNTGINLISISYRDKFYCTKIFKN